ncbi:MAG: NmrA/HSCARG family protein [Neisseria sp.]|uniref:NmrA/HSCARG family protein n=1 Tax=Neisseria sp. TaxID=192066 RepID=UPI0026DAD367|nr:NmrA/HSCARG family protein [Neisseria sp.]MDO4642066.1 NmrA/HSCARG family protein [Neisseria sp.]
MTISSLPLVAVAGAGSKQGRSVVASLLNSGLFRVRALTRHPDSSQARLLQAMGAEVVKAPLALGHQNEMTAAMRGAEAAFLMTPPTDPQDSQEFALGCQLADSAVAAGVQHIIFSTLENVDAITQGQKFAPHFTDKARVADYIRTLPIAHSFIILAFFYTNLFEYYLPRREGDALLMPIYLPEDFRAPFVDPLTATGPAILEILRHREKYQGQTLPVVGDFITPREMVETFQRVTGIRTEYRNAYTREGLLRYFPEFSANELLVRELLGMVQYAVEYGYFSADNQPTTTFPGALNWETFLRQTGWRGEKHAFGL